MQLLYSAGASNLVLSQPQGTDKPGIPLSLAQITCHLVIIIVLVAGHASNLRLHPQCSLKLLHGTLDKLVSRREHAKLEEPA